MEGEQIINKSKVNFLYEDYMKVTAIFKMKCNFFFT